MGDLIAADTEQDTQDFHFRDLLGEGRIQTQATLLDKAEVKGGGVGKGLSVVRRSEIGVR
jgi:hypothetical protein